MDWITEQIAIGNYLDAQDANLLRQGGFQSVLSLDGTLAEERAVELSLLEVVSVKLIDGAGNDPRRFRYAVESLSRLVRSCAPVLVQCHAGRSRSAVVVAGYLVKSLEMEPEQATAYVASKRAINITPALESLLY